ncbi:HNH endonuclease [Pantoea phage PdC23]|uniref:HNH endonuclease n=1 Tax=Pantoea phage PdC23 TaxID=2894356 RepID=A0AAE8YHI5_9CAUD|nr:HNH endonuclease [Pantoea phage PdC23]UGC97755.1 HNH endonuclease [Pantoea phage PdC23]
MEYNSLFSYDNGSLKWRIHRHGVRKNKEAGCLDTDGYRKVMIDGVSKREHRIIWEMFFGDIPEGMEIDHINGVRNDNRIENLRVVSKTCNQLNRNKMSNNSSGITGVSFDRTKNRWKSQFRKKQLGSFTSFIEACESRIVAEVSSGLCTERHGK